MEGGVETEELRKVPYITHIPLDGRSVALLPFLDRNDNSWKQFVPQGTKLTWIFAKPVESSYFSETINDPERDMYLKVADIITRRFSYQSTMDIRFQITTKVIFSAVMLEKYFLSLIRYRNIKDPLIADLVMTDLEYLFTNARAIYDLIQRLFSDLWQRETGIPMKNSFAKVCQKSREDLASKYKLPETMIEYYLLSKDFMIKIRSIRDAILHYSADSANDPERFAFCDEDGFALIKSSLLRNPGLSFDIWPDGKVKPNGLVSVLALIAYVNKMVVENTDNFSDALIRTIDPPPAITESHKLFLRSPYVHHLLKADEYLKEQWVKDDLESRLSHSAR